MKATCCRLAGLRGKDGAAGGPQRTVSGGLAHARARGGGQFRPVPDLRSPDVAHARPRPRGCALSAAAALQKRADMHAQACCGGPRHLECVPRSPEVGCSGATPADGHCAGCVVLDNTLLTDLSCCTRTGSWFCLYCAMLCLRCKAGCSCATGELYFIAPYVRRFVACRVLDNLEIKMHVVSNGLLAHMNCLAVQ